MATNTISLKKKIETLKKGLNNKFISATQKAKIKLQVEKLEKQVKAAKPAKAQVSSTLSRLQKLVNKKKFGVYKDKGVDLKKDADRPALRIGKRTAKKSGNTYYEYRANRIDVKQPSKTARYPKLEDGGMMAKGGVLNNKQKLILELHETLEKANELIMQIYPETQQEFDKLPWNTRENLIATRKAIYDALSHRFMSGFEKGGYMADGGVTEKEVVESNAQMVLSKIKEVKHHADELSHVVSTKSDIEAWVVAKIERASTDLSDITHYLDGQKDKMSMGGSIRYYTHKMDKK